MDQVLYGLLAARARMKCECGCGRGVPPGEVDHFWGRAKAEEVEQACWVLTPECHRAKTDNRPSAAHWLEKYIAHCRRWNYVEWILKAENKLAWLRAKGVTP